MNSLLKHAVLFITASLTLHAESFPVTTPPELPTPVASFGAAATTQGQVYIYGGHAGVRHKYNREDVNGDLYLWQKGNSTWQKLASEEPAQGASLIALPDQILRIGGMAAKNAKGDNQDLWSSETAVKFDLKSKQWIALPMMPERRSSHDSTVVGQTLYVIGGWALGGGHTTANEPHWHDTFLTLDLSKEGANWQSHPQPFKRRALAVQAIGTRLHMIGGMDQGDKPTSTVDIFDTVSKEWSKGPELPSDKLGGFGYSAIAHEGRLFASGLPGDVLELKDGAWVSVAKMSHPRFFHRLVPGNAGQIIVLGGESRDGKKAPPEVVTLPSKEAPTKAASLAEPDKVTASAGN